MKPDDEVSQAALTELKEHTEETLYQWMVKMERRIAGMELFAEGIASATEDTAKLLKATTGVLTQLVAKMTEMEQQIVLLKRGGCRCPIPEWYYANMLHVYRCACCGATTSINFYNEMRGTIKAEKGEPK